MVLVQNCAGLFEILKKEMIIAFDSETTGLRWYHGDFAFAWGFHTSSEVFIYDLRDKNTEQIDEFYRGVQDLLNREDLIVLGANPKFDLHMSKVSDYRAKVVDVSILKRLIDTNALAVGLAAIGKDIGVEKDDSVKKWIQKNKAYKWEKNSLGELVKIPRYDAVPIEMLHAYLAKDCEVTYKSYFHYIKQIDKLDEYNRNLVQRNGKSLYKVIEKEIELTKSLFLMEKQGVKLDVEYADTALRIERDKYTSSAETFKQLTGHDFRDSANYYVELFGASSEFVKNAPKTQKGNLSFTDEYLSSVNSDVTKSITSYRKAYKKAGTYYSTFKDLVDSNGKIHTSFRQAATSTGRLSSSDPNLQNVSNSEDAEATSVRGCFVAPEDYYWVSIDYQAQEMRVMLEFSEQFDIIDRVKAGEDLHQATADIMGSTRKEAKTINFGLLYGMGISKLAGTLGVTDKLAKDLKYKYMAKFSAVRDFTTAIINKVKKCGKIANIEGRLYTFDEGFEYKALNYLIQGTSAEITKTAMINCTKFLKPYSSKLVLSVHDELVFYIHKDELHLIPDIARIMKEAFPHKFLPMDVGIEIGKRWSELEDYNKWLENQNQTLKTS